MWHFIQQYTHNLVIRASLKHLKYVYALQIQNHSTLKWNRFDNYCWIVSEEFSSFAAKGWAEHK